MSTLPCGHQVHTHCLINEFVNNYARTTCGTCQQRVVEERVHQFYDNGNGRPRQTVAHLWNTSEEFRNDIKELKQRQLKYNRVKKEFKSAADVIKSRFKENIRTSLEVIRDQKRASITEYKRIPCKRTYNSLGNSCVRKINQIHGTYGIGPWDIRRNLRDIPGAPKFSETNHYYRWRASARYFFRVKI